MAMFIVYYKGYGHGCDYTIGCNEKTFVLPESVTTVEQAVEYIKGEDSHSLSYYGIKRIAKATIYEVSNMLEVDVESIRSQQEEEIRKHKRKVQDQKDLAELDSFYERIQEKLVKG